MATSKPSADSVIAGEGACIRVEVVRAWPRRFVATALELPAGATVADALALAPKYLAEHASGDDFSASYPADKQDAAVTTVAIFGERVALVHVLASGDRIEVLRPLLADPKDARRRRAKT